MLRDHFHPPLLQLRHWNSFHYAWACNIAGELNQMLPERWFAEPNIQFGIEEEAAWHRGLSVPFNTFEIGSTYGDSAAWELPTPTRTIDFAGTTDLVEVQIWNHEGCLSLAGAIELISPANKDRSETREAFVSKCATYLRDEVGLLIVDPVTSRHANLHGELMDRFGHQTTEREQSELYAASYRPRSTGRKLALDVWYEQLDIGRPLTSMPLSLKGSVAVQVDLPATYQQTCDLLRLNEIH